MTASNAILTNAALNSKVTNAVLDALKAGMDKSDVAAALAKMAEMLEASDEE